MFVLQQKFGVASAPNFGRIEGRVFYDENGNGAFDPGEPGADEARVRLGSGDKRVLTDPTGRFLFSRMPPGTQEVLVDVANVDADWLLAVSRQAVEVKRRRTTQVWFPLMRGVRLGGTVFIDGNGDGKFQETEEPMEGVTVVLGPPEDFRRTGEDGRYDFEFLPAGEYEVRLYQPGLPKGYELESPGTVLVGLGGGEERLDVDFAVRFTAPVQEFKE
jgi:hypothetical protein